MVAGPDFSRGPRRDLLSTAAIPQDFEGEQPRCLAIVIHDVEALGARIVGDTFGMGQLARLFVVKPAEVIAPGRTSALWVEQKQPFGSVADDPEAAGLCIQGHTRHIEMTVRLVIIDEAECWRQFRPPQNLGQIQR